MNPKTPEPRRWKALALLCGALSMLGYSALEFGASTAVLALMAAASSIVAQAAEALLVPGCPRIAPQVRMEARPATGAAD